jgi:phosphoserine phosphatase
MATEEDKEIILLKVSGQDKPGVTAGLTAYCYV